MKYLILILLIVACGQNPQESSTTNPEYDRQLKELQDQVNAFAKISDLQSKTIDAMNAADESLQDKFDTLYGDVVHLHEQVKDLEDTEKTDYLNLQTEISSLQNIVTNLSEEGNTAGDWRELPGCSHSFFVLYNYNLSIRSVYVNELKNIEHMKGAWDIFGMPENYGLVIGNDWKCRNFNINTTRIKYWRFDTQNWFEVLL